MGDVSLNELPYAWESDNIIVVFILTGHMVQSKVPPKRIFVQYKPGKLSKKI